MSKLKKIIKASLPIIVTYLLSYGVILLSGLIYNLFGYSNLDFFLYQITPYILILYYLIVIIRFLKKFPIQKKNPVKYYPQISLGLSLAIFLNMLIFKIIPPTISPTTISLPLEIISSGLIGPIYEELLFRHIFYNSLKEFNPKRKSLLITTIVFALIHLSPIKIIYAFILGLILNIIYERDQNIISPIITHIAANTIVIFLSEYNTYIFLLSLVSLSLSIYINLKEK